MAIPDFAGWPTVPTRTAVVVLALVLPLLAGCSAAHVDLAPVVEIAPTASGALNWRALGPLAENRISPDGKEHLLALPRPLFSQYADNARGWLYRDYCWPLGFSRYRADGGYDYFTLFFHSFENPESPTHVTRWWLLPFFFFGRDRQGESYAALFPLYGRIGNLASYDSIRFCLFPLYLGTERAGAHSKSFLWPVFGYTTGENIEKRRVFPLYGYSWTPREKRLFILWPFGHTVVQYPDAAGRQGSGWFILPLYGQFRQSDAAGTTLYHSWTFLWPFFSGESGADHDRFYGPWPFFRREHSAAADLPVEQLHFWPFYGHIRRGTQETTSIAWPFFQTTTGSWQNGSVTDAVLNPFYQAGEKIEKGQQVERHLQIWPLWRFEKEGDVSRTAVLDIWPYRHQTPIDRNFAPFWTLYTCERRATAVRHEALWGWLKLGGDAAEASYFSLVPLLDYSAAADRHRVSLLEGFVAWGRDKDGAHGRLLWFISW